MCSEICDPSVRDQIADEDDETQEEQEGSRGTLWWEDSY